MLTKETTASEVVVKEIVGTDSRNNEHMLPFMNVKSSFLHTLHQLT